MKNRKMKLLVVGLLLVALVLPAAAYAYFTDYEDAWGGAVIKLEGETKIHEEASTDKKVVSIENTGDTNVIVRVGIFGDYISGITFENKKDWTHKDGDDWYYYSQILKPGETTSSITATVNKTAAEDAGHDFDIVVVHESERVSYDGTADNKVRKPDGWTNMPAIYGSSEEVGD